MAEKWLVSFNPNEAEYIPLSRKLNIPVHSSVIMNNQVITEVESHKHLGVTFESSGTWHKHIQLITTKEMQRIHIMRKLKFRLDRKALETIYLAFIRPILEYADVVWCNITKYEEENLRRYSLKLPG